MIECGSFEVDGWLFNIGMKWMNKEKYAEIHGNADVFYNRGQDVFKRSASY